MFIYQISSVESSTGLKNKGGFIILEYLANYGITETCFKIFKRGQHWSAFGTWIYNILIENLRIHHENLEVICIAWNVFIFECYAQKGPYQEQKSDIFCIPITVYNTTGFWCYYSKLNSKLQGMWGIKPDFQFYMTKIPMFLLINGLSVFSDSL